MRAQFLSCCFALICIAMSQPASAEVGAHVKLTSNYIWRGLDQSSKNPAIQGGFDLNFQNGLYGGIWGSSIYDATSTDAGNLELDFKAGFTKSFGDYGLDLAYIRYEYPRSDADFKEVLLRGNYKGLSLAYYHNQSSPVAGEHEAYVRAKANINLPSGVGLTLALGQSLIKDANEDISDALIGFSKGFDGFQFGFAVSANDIDCATGSPANTDANLCPFGDDTETEFVTLSVSKDI